MIKKETIEEESWDKKKIVIGILSFLVLLFAFLYFKNTLFPNKSEIKGVSTISTTKQDENLNKASEKLQEKINEVKQNVDNLNVAEVASSSPQVQKVLNDIKSLEDLPRNQAREACVKICSGL